MIELVPADADALSQRGLLYVRLGELDLAMADYTRVTQILPTDPWAWALRGALRARCGDTAGGAEDFDRALSQARDPDAIRSIVELRCSVGLGCDGGPDEDLPLEPSET